MALHPLESMQLRKLGKVAKLEVEIKEWKDLCAEMLSDLNSASDSMCCDFESQDEARRKLEKAGYWGV